MKGPRAAYAMRPDIVDQLFDAGAKSRLDGLVDIQHSLCLTSFDQGSASESLDSLEILITGWACPMIDRASLESMPRLRAVIHAAGTVKHHVSEQCWDQGIAVSSAAEANARPVAEFTLSYIIQAGKNTDSFIQLYRQQRGFIDFLDVGRELGNNGRRVGLVGASRVGRCLIELLRPFDFAVTVADPYLSDSEAEQLGVTLMTLDELVSQSDILSIHAPVTPSTIDLIDGQLLARLPDGATVINTARGAVIDQDALTAELSSGRIRAILDVTSPHGPLDAGSPLWDLDNVILTPHMAGAFGNELTRLGDWAVEEVRRFVSGEPLRGEVSLSALDILA